MYYGQILGLRLIFILYWYSLLLFMLFRHSIKHLSEFVDVDIGCNHRGINLFLKGYIMLYLVYENKSSCL